MQKGPATVHSGNDKAIYSPKVTSKIRKGDNLDVTNIFYSSVELTHFQTAEIIIHHLGFPINQSDHT